MCVETVVIRAAQHCMSQYVHSSTLPISGGHIDSMVNFVCPAQTGIPEAQMKTCHTYFKPVSLSDQHSLIRATVRERCQVADFIY